MQKQLMAHFNRGFRKYPLSLLSNLIVLTATYTILAGFFLVSGNIEHSFSSISDDVQMNVYLKDDVSEENRSVVKRELMAVPGFSTVKFISKSEAAAEFRQQMAAYSADLLSEDVENPLPDSFEMSLDKKVSEETKVSVLDEAAKKITSIVGVETVSYGRGWVENYATVLRSFKISSILLLFVLISGGMLVVSHSIKNTLSQRRDEIEIMELVGATANEIRMPFVAEGAVLGLAASVFSLGLTYVLFATQSSMLQEELSFLGIANGLQFLSGYSMMLIVALGVGLGALGSYLTVARINTGWAAAARSNGSH